MTFYNVNRQKIKTQTLTTDEFGSFTGTFKTPKGGRMGRMSISSNLGGSKSISVEEYKRPKFEVEFEAHEQQFKLGEKVTLTGVAKAYAGNAIDGVTVKFQVRRTTYFPWYWNGRKYPPSRPVIVKRGTVKTDKDGRFSIEFIAKEDQSVDKKRNPRYTYSIYANVVDMTGESHSLETSFTTGVCGL